MNCIFQLVRSGDGSRLPPITLSRAEFARALEGGVRDAPGMADYLVLVLVEDIQTDGNFRVSAAPMLRVDSFIQLFGESHNVEDVSSAARSVGAGSLYQHAEG